MADAEKALEHLLQELAGLPYPAVRSTVERPAVEARYSTLVEQIPAVIFMAFLDEGVSHAYVSPHIEAALGFTQEEWLTDPVLWYRQIHPDDQARWSLDASRLVTSAEPLRAVYRVMSRAGKTVWFHCQVKIVRSGDGQPWFIHGVGIDITDLKVAEQAVVEAHNELEARVQQRTAELTRVNAELKSEIAERERAEADLALRADELSRANQDLEQFAYSASHDLQEPLRNIAIFSQWLSRKYKGKLDADADQTLDRLHNDTQRMMVLVRDVLSYTRVASERVEQNQLADAEVAFNKSLENLEAAIRSRRAVVSHDPLPRVPIHEIHLLQIFQNLISNAITYTTEPPRVHVSASAVPEGWRFSVKDNGIGINPEYHERIFGMFKRLHTREKYAGSGIGLAICKRSVERHGGRIWLESAMGQGSTFYFTLPGSNNQ